jgi:hypothetical protein
MKQESSTSNGFSEKTLFGKTNVIITEYTKVEEQNDEDDALKAANQAREEMMRGIDNWLEK